MSEKVIDFTERRRLKDGMVTSKDLEHYSEEEIFSIIFGKDYIKKNKNGISGKEAKEIVDAEFAKLTNQIWVNYLDL